MKKILKYLIKEIHINFKNKKTNQIVQAVRLNQFNRVLIKLLISNKIKIFKERIALKMNNK
jgi:hypothetical protein